MPSHRPSVIHGIEAITLDLDDTLWPVVPVIRAAEQRLWDWIAARQPAVAARFDATSLVEVRNRVALAQPHIVHDLTLLRLETLRSAFAECGAPESGADDAMAVFLDARNDVSFFSDSVAGLTRLAERFPILAVSNGNADFRRAGLGELLTGSMSAIEAGCAKPHRDIFLKACGVLGTVPERTLHVGDHPEQDVLGATDAGLPTAWINREGGKWNYDRQPDVIAADMLELADCLLDG